MVVSGGWDRWEEREVFIIIFMPFALFGLLL